MIMLLLKAEVNNTEFKIISASFTGKYGTARSKIHQRGHYFILSYQPKPT